MKKSILLASEIGLKVSGQTSVNKFDNAALISQHIFPGCKLVLDIAGQYYTSPIKSSFSWSIEGSCGGTWGDGNGSTQLWPYDPSQPYIIRFGQEGSNAVCGTVSDITFRAPIDSKCNAIEIYRGVNIEIRNCSFQYFKHAIDIEGTKANLCTSIRSCNFDRNKVGIYCNALGMLASSSSISSACLSIVSNNFSGGEVGIFLNRGVRQNIIQGNLIQGQAGASIAVREMSRVTMISNYLECGKTAKGERIPTIALFGPCRVKVHSGEFGVIYSDGDIKQQFSYVLLGLSVNGIDDTSYVKGKEGLPMRVALPSTFPKEYLTGVV